MLAEIGNIMFTHFFKRDLSSPLKDNWVETLPEYVKDGVLCAKENQCSLRIRDWSTFDFMIPKRTEGKIARTSDEVILDLRDLSLYPDLRGLSITTNFNLIQRCATLTLFTDSKI